MSGEQEGLHSRLFKFFYFLMEGKMDQHMLEEGDRWLEEDTVEVSGETLTKEEQLDRLLFQAVAEYKKTLDLEQLEDIANFCAARRIRGLLRGR